MKIVDFDKLSEMYWDGNSMEIHKDDIPSIPSAFEGMTNGEVIQALFPHIEVQNRGLIVNVKGLDCNKDTLDPGRPFWADWWNAPYIAEIEPQKKADVKIVNVPPIEVFDKIKAEIESMDFDFGDYYDNTDKIIEMVCKAIDKCKAEIVFDAQTEQNTEYER